MNSLQQELDNINQQLEHLNARKNQLEPIISEYSDVIERVKNLVSNMIDVNVEPSNLMFDIQDLVNLEDEPDTTPEPTPEPQPGQDFPSDWMQVTEAAHLQPEEPENYCPVCRGTGQLWTDDEDGYYVDCVACKGKGTGLEQEPTPEPEPQPGQDFPTDWMQVTEVAHSSQSETTETEQATESKEQPEDFDTFYPELTPEPTRQPVRLMAFVPTFLTQEPTPEPTPAPSYCPRCLGTGIINKLIPEPATPDPDYDQWDVTAVSCPECTHKPEPEPLTQINLQAYRRGEDVLIIGFTNKRLMNQWSKWFKSSWSGDQAHISDHSDNLQGFNYCLTVLWFGNPHWERLTKLNYSLKPTEQNLP